jgi:putative Holliday junction resolvase
MPATHSVSRSGVYLGFDFGMRRIGVAVGEPLTGSARPLTTLQARDGQPDWTAVETLLSQWQPVALVVGIPRHADGTAAEMTAPAERFARRLHGRFGRPVHTIDEQLSSQAAEHMLAAKGQGGRRLAKNKEKIDQVAAAVILETWLAERPDDRTGNGG